MKLLYKLLSLIIAISLLLTGSILPISTTAISDDNNSTNEIVLNEETIKSEERTLSDKAVLCAEDTEISEESMILRYIDSSQFNAAKHVQRLIEMEDLNTYVFANADGTRSIYTMHENVKYVDEDGTVREKDISLKSKTGGFGTERNNVELFIPNNPIQGIDLEYSGFAVKLIPQGLINIMSAAQTDNSVVYDKAYGENTKLVYTPMLSGVKEDIVLTEYTANVTYTFILETDGLSVYEDEGDYYLASSKNADPVFYLGEILIYDAVGKPAVGTMTVEAVTEEQKYLLTVTADDDFLSDSTTVYPVTIDPSITVSDSTTTGSIIDAPIFAGYPSSNFGTFIYNSVGTTSASYGVGRTVVKLSGLTDSDAFDTITANQITNVTFYAKEASGTNTQYINLHPLTNNTTWTESTVTWNNVGSFNTSVNYGNTMYNNQWTAFNITNLVKEWKRGTYSANAGFIMTNENETNYKCFCSSEYSTSSYRPYVVLTYKPIYEYTYKENAPIQYTYRASLNLSAGDTITFSTKKATSYADVDTVLNLFYSSNPTTSNSWVSDDYNGTHYSQLTVTIPTSGNYTLLVRTFSGSVGYCNVYKNGVLYKENAQLGGYKLFCQNITGTQNFFTANSVGVDTLLYVMDSSNKVLAYNDDYRYNDEATTGDFFWGNHSRVHKNMTTKPYYVFVAGYVASEEGTTDIYANCRDGFTDTYDFPNLKALDSIKAQSADDTYNCIAWSGGIAHKWINPFRAPETGQGNLSYLDPWYDEDPVKAFDNFYGNKPQRYIGSTTYVPTDDATNAIIDVYYSNSTNKWTHASVRKPGNDMPHGYAWESKLGASQRIFHARNALEGGLYGSIMRHYTISTGTRSSTSISNITLDESIRMGLTVENIVLLSNNELAVLQEGRSAISSKLMKEFEAAYSTWVTAINENDEFSTVNNDTFFAQMNEFAALSDLIQNNKSLVYAVVDLYLQNQDVFARTLFETTVVPLNSKTIALAHQVRETNNTISFQSMKDVYIAPSFEANVMTFIKELLNNPTMYFDDGNVIKSGNLLFED